MEGVELITFVNSKVIPISIFLIMMGMGLSLVTNDFKRVVKYPKAVAIGLTNQLLFLPLVGFALATFMSLEPEYAVGVMLLVLCPGGTTSNLFTYLAKGDVALSVTMTAIASVITVFTIPIVPSIGMLIKRYAASFADKAQVMVSRFGVIFLSFLVIFLGYVQRDILVEALVATGPVSLILNVSTMALGYYTSKWFGLNPAQRRSITMEVGLQNSTLSMFMALTLLANYKMSLTPAIYTLIMFLTAGIMVRVFTAQHNKANRVDRENSVLAARRM